MKRVRRLRQLIGAVGVAGGIAAGAVAPALALDVTDYGDETKLAAAVWEQLEGSGQEGIAGVWQLVSNSGPLILVVALRQQYAGQDYPPRQYPGEYP